MTFSLVIEGVLFMPNKNIEAMDVTYDIKSLSDCQLMNDIADKCNIEWLQLFGCDLKNWDALSELLRDKAHSSEFNTIKLNIVYSKQAVVQKAKSVLELVASYWCQQGKQFIVNFYRNRKG